jgi:lipopolysaccharide/colanic/teichoic acid biosynthesis glycosyltransferase
MDTITKENTRDSDFQIMEPLPALFMPAPEELTSNYLPVKRVLDVVISSVLLLTVLSWLYPLLSVLIRLTSKGGTLFIQRRIGRNGKIFNCYKFRTMVVNNDADMIEAQLNDSRITKIGKWLRSTYIDELPQLINVLAGDMSIVGPRPHMLYHHHKFCSEVPSYDCRHSVNPGITGLSQVKGYHGSMFAPYRIHGRTRLDLFYVEKMSLKLDMMILAKTFLIVFSKDKK